jgi:SAM-dependent methyltransferase/adenylate kinase family enzyme
MSELYQRNLDAATPATRELLAGLAAIQLPPVWKVTPGRRGSPTVQIPRPSGTTWLNSPVNPEVEAEKLAAAIPAWAGGCVLVGMELGYLLNAVHKALHPSRPILAVVPEPSYLKLAMESLDLTAPLASERVCLAIAPSHQEAKPILQEFCRGSRFCHFIIPAAFYLINPELYGKFAATVEYQIHSSDERRPRVILICGDPGSGKTYLGRALNERYSWAWRSADHIGRMIMDVIRSEFQLNDLAVWNALAQGLDIDRLQEHLYRDFARQVRQEERGVSDGWVYKLRRFREPLRAALRDLNTHPSHTLVNIIPPYDEYVAQQRAFNTEHPDRPRVWTERDFYEAQAGQVEEPSAEEMTDLVTLRGQAEVAQFVERIGRWEGTKPFSVSLEPPEPWDAARARVWLTGKQFYQRVKIGNMVVAGDVDSLTKVDLLQLPKDFGGDSLLDIGCNTGGFCFAAKRRGAGRVVGTDVNGEFIMWARRIRDHVERLPNLEFYPMDVMRIGELGQFDYILLLAALHYMPDIKRVFKLIGDACRKALVMDLVMAPNLLDGSVPALEYRKDYKDFVPNLAALKELVAPHFSRLETVGRSVAPDKSLRIIFHAHK